MSKHTPGPRWIDDDGFLAAGKGDAWERFFNTFARRKT